MSLTSIYKIYTEINNVHLERLDVLREPIVQIQNVMHGIETDIKEIHAVLSRYSQSIQDNRFNEVVMNTRNICLNLNKTANDLYSAQHAISNYYTKIAKFENKHVSSDVIMFRKFEFSFPNIFVDETKVIFNKNDMMQVWHSLGDFNGNISKRANELRDIPQNIDGWQDEQKLALQDVLNEIGDSLMQLLIVFVDYRDYLGVVINYLI